MESSLEDYLNSRFDPQLAWYGRKSAHYKKYSQTLNVVTLVGGILTPILGSGGYRQATLITATIVAIGLAMLKYFKFEDQWYTYRTTVEELKREKIHFSYGVDVYAYAEEPEKLFIERSESLIGGEHLSWCSLVQEKPAHKGK
ncbi:MAG TPA: DUF4231 domain-containing protein [Methanoregulaceae archaeon]|nr:DUF4231 domain-containing protein [Methanoregulaceae archaeon]